MPYITEAMLGGMRILSGAPAATQPAAGLIVIVFFIRHRHSGHYEHADMGRAAYGAQNTAGTPPRQGRPEAPYPGVAAL